MTGEGQSAAGTVFADSVPHTGGSEPVTGLTEREARERRSRGLDNAPVDPPGKSVAQIVAGHVFTYFNLVFFVLAGFLVSVRSWNNLMFMGTVLINLGIGIVQELHSKKILDALRLLDAPRCVCLREGREREMDSARLVLGDVVRFSRGDQVCADAEVLSGDCQVNEALVTGEAEEVPKKPGDSLRSGSFLVSGSCLARLTAVGADAYANRLTLAARGRRRKKEAGMMGDLSRLVKWIGLLLIPMGLLLYGKEVHALGRSHAEGVVSAVGALVGMIPEGLYLLTTVALSAGVLRLAGKKTLVHELKSIETLARVDTLCVDKTGTITETKMAVERVVPLCPERYTAEDAALIMADYVAALRDDNDTMAALRGYFQEKRPGQEAIATLPFTSARKYGGVSFHRDETYLLGAPEILLGENYPKYAEEISGWSAKGCRVLLLANYDGQLSDAPLSAPLLPIALLLLNNKLRPAAPETFRYFARQGVAVKVISGDNPLTVSEVAKRAGIPGAEAWVDARTLSDPAALARAAESYTVFGRVTPEQKRELVRALKAKGHTVAMTGDGVNDVLALKEADCSVALAAGTDAAGRVSDLVLLNNDFSVLPAAVGEGRRVINNIERSATLFLVKNIFSFTLALASLLFTLPYPFSAAQLTLVSSVTIGWPAFVLAMEPNESRIQGRFLTNVFRRAVPPALADFTLTIGVLLFYYAFSLDRGMLSTVCAVTVGLVGMLLIFRLCRPFTPLRRALMVSVVAAFAVCVLFLPSLFTLSPLDFPGMLLLGVFACLAYPCLRTVTELWERFLAWAKRLREGDSRGL